MQTNIHNQAVTAVGLLTCGGYGGGWPGGFLSRVEVWDPETRLSCAAPDLPGGRLGHTTGHHLSWLLLTVVATDVTAAGLVTCGGRGGEGDCLLLRPGATSWVHLATISPRSDHVSWLTG